MTTPFSGPAAIDGVTIPDSRLGRAIAEFVRDTETDLLFNHSSRVYFFGALAGEQRGLRYDAELLYAATMFHDFGPMPAHASENLCFEVDGANAARDFLRGHGIAAADLDTVWAAIALHTTPGVEMDVLGLTYDRHSDAVRKSVVAAFPRTPAFKEEIIQAFYDGIKHKPDTTFGNVKADVIADKEPHFHCGNFCSVVRGSHWQG